MANILQEIIENKKQEIQIRKQNAPMESLKNGINEINTEKRGFKKGLLNSNKIPAIIAEIKKKSPSKGILREDFNVQSIAEGYEKNGASAISVLTDQRYFDGRIEHIIAAKQKTTVPILQKDFIIDIYQLFESVLYGADAVLLIAEALSRDALKELYEKASEFKLDCLIETHSLGELQKVLSIKPSSKNALIGINNRSLESFHVDLDHSFELIKHVPNDFLAVSESGIQTAEDLTRLKKCGIKAVLIGEMFMRSKDPSDALNKLISGL